MSLPNLPVILVSASDNAAARKVISALVENEAEDNRYREAGWTVWQITNKYYTAHVRVQPLLDGEELLDIPAEAHVIYLKEDEGVSEAETRRLRAKRVICPGAVRLLLVECAQITEAIAEWGLKARFEALAMMHRRPGGCRGGEEEEREGEPEGAAGGRGEDEDEWVGGEEEGAGRARGALHAHVWPLMQPHGLNGLAAPPEEWSSSDGEGEEGRTGEGEEEEEKARAVERAEAFAQALGGLGALAQLPPDAHEHRGLRLQRAHQLVAAFAHALGHSLDL